MLKLGIIYRKKINNCCLLLVNFKDENDVYFVHSLDLDLTGYGKNLEDAKKSFSIVFEDFPDLGKKL